MAAKPTLSDLRWAELADGTPAANLAAPTSGKKDTGFGSTAEAVAGGLLNTLFREAYRWAKYVDGILTDIAGTAWTWTAAHVFNAGITANTLTVTGACSLGASTFTSTVGIVGNTTVGGTFSAAGLVTFGGGLDVTTVALTAANPAIATGFTNTLTKANICKAWAEIEVSLAGVVTVNRGFNINTTPAVVGSEVRIAYTNAMAQNFNAVVVSGNNGDFILGVGTNSSTHFGIFGTKRNDGSALLCDGTYAIVMYVIVFALQ